MIQDNNVLFNSVKSGFKELLDDDSDIDMNSLTQSFIMSFYEEADLYSLIGTIPFFISDGNKDFVVFIDFKQNGEVFILDIEESQD